MKIKWVEVKNFKSFKEKIRFNLFDNNIVVGHNGVGKTSLCEAISYTLTGKSLVGWTQLPDIINLNHPKDEMETAVLLIDEESFRECEIRRSRKGTKEKITFNNLESNQTELDKLIGSADIFLSIFNPKYFPYVLEANEKRELIEKVCPKISYEDIFSEKLDLNLLEKYNISIYAPNEYKKIKEQKDKIEQQILEIKTNIKVLSEENLNVAQGTDLEDKTEELKKLKEKYDKVQKVYLRQQELKSLIEKSKDFSDQVFKIKQELNQLPQIKEVNNNIDELMERKKKFININNQKIKELQSKQIPASLYPSKIEKTKNCPTCNQILSDEYILEFNKKIESKHNEYDKINEELGIQIKSLDEDNQKADVALNNKIKEIQNTINSNTNITNKNNELTNKLEILDKNIYVLTPKDEELLKFDCNLIIQEYEKVLEHDRQYQLTKSQNDYISNKKKENLNKISNLNNQLIEIELKFNELKMIYDTIHPSYLQKRIAEKQLSTLHDNLTNIKIELFKETQSGSAKSVFDIYYNNKPYRMLSNSESILCGIELCNMFNKLTGLKIPIFIDNYECISEEKVKGLQNGVQSIKAKFIDNESLNVVVG